MTQKFSIFHQAEESKLKSWHQPYADLFLKKTTVLDVGCGIGYFLDLLKDRGILCTGLDSDEEMVNLSRKRGHDVLHGDQTQISNYEEYFDGIHMSHVIEHLWGDEAVKMLESSVRALKVSGVLIVRTPFWGNREVRHGGFWLDHTHKRPYPTELLRKIIVDLGMTVDCEGNEPFGWEDSFIVAHKPFPGASDVPRSVFPAWPHLLPRNTEHVTLMTRLRNRVARMLLPSG